MARQVSGRRGGDFGQWLSFHSAGWSPLIFHLFWCAFLTFCFYSYFVVPFLYFLTTVRGGARWCFIFFMCLFYIFYQSADDISSFCFCFYVPFLHCVDHSADDINQQAFPFFIFNHISFIFQWQPLLHFLPHTVPMIFRNTFSSFLVIMSVLMFYNHIHDIFQ